MKRFLLIAWLLTTSIASAAEPVSTFIQTSRIGTDIKCSEEAPNLIEIRLGDRIVRVRLTHLASTPILSQGDICVAFLRSLKRELEAKKETQLEIELYERDRQFQNDADEDDIPSLMIESGALEKKCIEMGYCVPGAFGRFDAREEIRSCNPRFSFSKLWKRIKPRFLKTAMTPIDRVDVELFPFTGFGQEMLAEAKSLEPGQLLLASTMSIGQQAVGELVGKLTEADSGAFLAADAGLLLAEQQSSVLKLSQMQNRLYVLPMTRDTSFSAFYHWKMFVRSSGSESILTSMNLTNPLKVGYTDALYRFHDPAVAAELRKLIIDAAASQCEVPEDFRCMAAALAQKPEDAPAWGELFRKGCDHFNQIRSTVAAGDQRRFFLEPYDSDLPAVIASLIDNARSEVILLTHQLFFRGIEYPITQALKRGVRVRVLTYEDTALDSRLAQSVVLTVDPEKLHSKLPSPHMKALMIDRKLMFFGTGNFTYNGLENGKELFAQTTDKNAIDIMLQVARSLERSTEQAKRVIVPVGRPAERQLVVLPVTKNAEPAPLEPETADLIRRYTFALPEQWQKKFVEVTREGRDILTRCDLNEMIFLSIDDFTACVQQENEGEGKANY